MQPDPDAGVVQPDAAVGCDADQDCKVVSDCCSCKGIYQWEQPASCPVACAAPKCDNWGLSWHRAYCVGGRCKVTAQAGSCATDADCIKINDCCNCLALPKTVSGPPTCPLANCYVPTCSVEGLATTAARCVAGVCRLVL